MPRIAPFVEAGEQFQHLIPFEGLDEGLSHAVRGTAASSCFPVGVYLLEPERLRRCSPPAIYAVMEHTASAAAVPVSMIGSPRPTSYPAPAVGRPSEAQSGRVARALAA